MYIMQKSTELLDDILNKITILHVDIKSTEDIDLKSKKKQTLQILIDKACELIEELEDRVNNLKISTVNDKIDINTIEELVYFLNNDYSSFDEDMYVLEKLLEMQNIILFNEDKIYNIDV